MLRIYIDKIMLGRLCQNNTDKSDPDEQDPWYKLIVLQDFVYTNITEKVGEAEDYSQLLSEQINSENPDEEKIRELRCYHFFATLRESKQTSVLPCDVVNIDQIASTHGIVVNDPCAIYILDIEPEEANRIQKDYGVICQSMKDMDITCLTSEGCSYAPKTNDKNYGWRKVLRKFKELPSSSIIINDRNLFTNDHLFKGSDEELVEKTSGIENVKMIIDTLIPRIYNGGNYHVIVFSEFTKDENKKTVLDFSEVSKRLNQICIDICEARKKKIKIDVEFFAFVFGKNEKTNYYGHSITHNRRILSNYFILSCEHKLNAFDEAKSTCSQKIDGCFLYHTGLSGDGNDPAEKLHNDMINDFKDFIKYYCDHDKEEYPKDVDSFLKYSKNGEEIPVSTLCKIENRILV